MGLFNQRVMTAEDNADVLTSGIGGYVITPEIAMEIPALAGGIRLICETIASTPIKLYKETGRKKTDEIADDRRVFLLNDEPNDNMTAFEFWTAIIEDSLLRKGGYAYIDKGIGKFNALWYVKAEDISKVERGAEIIKKSFMIQCGGRNYEPYEFIRILRGSRDGITGTPITAENKEAIASAFSTMRLEFKQAKTSGKRPGFLSPEKPLDKKGIEKLKEAFRKAYDSENDETTVILNAGMKFFEGSATSAEMQIVERKKNMTDEFAMIMHVAPSIISGKASADEIAAFARVCIIPQMKRIEAALNRSMLLEVEKGQKYFAFDTKELLKGDVKTRFEAYKIALDANFMQPDEVRYQEDLPALGLNFVELGLNDVLYDPKTGTVYTPNTGKTETINRKSINEGSESNAEQNED